MKRDTPHNFAVGLAGTIARVKFKIIRCDGHILNLRARMPFRFGITTMTFTPHLFLSVELSIDGQRISGVAADHLPPKWFTKNPHTSYRDDVTEMLGVIRHATDAAIQLPPSPSIYALWEQLHAHQKAWIELNNLPPLLGFFGVSLVERAMIDAYCRSLKTPFASLLQKRLLGIPDLPLELLPDQPLRSVIARHTVGLTDPITAADIAPEERIDDGLPQSLDECIRTYGLTHFKIKLCGDVAEDLHRLRRLAEVIAAESPNYAFTLDGNENFHSIEPFRALWKSLTDDTALHPFLQRLLFVEQPLHRDVALSEPVKHAMLAWADRPPIIIDESDATMTSLPTALDSGYAGTSHKNCKGIFKGIRNACRIAELRRTQPQGRWILSGEDLSNVGPVSLLQDLAMMASLGITHVERNGQHYFRGLSALPPELQSTVLQHHPDLYHLHARGFPTLDIQAGKIKIDSVMNAPFGMDFDFDPSQFTSWNDWTFDSIES